MNKLTGDGIGVRFLFASALVLATYNPSGYSYFHWVKSIFPSVTSITPYIAIAGVALVAGWVIYIRATLRSLGPIGIGLVAAVSACIVWLFFEWGILSLEYKRSLAWMLILLLSFALTVGMCWSHIRRIMSGQVDSDDVGSDD